MAYFWFGPSRFSMEGAQNPRRNMQLKSIKIYRANYNISTCSWFEFKLSICNLKFDNLPI